MDLIERIVYINLDKRPDRRAQIEEELKRMNLHGKHFSALDLPDHGAVGCTISHAQVVRQAANDRVSSLLVLEDDFYWKVPDRATLDRRLTETIDALPTYDVIMFDYSVDIGEPLNEYCTRGRAVSCSAGYLVAGQYLDRLATCLEESATLFMQQPHVHWLYTIDQYWKRLQATDQWYCATPRFGTQRDGYSDCSNNISKHTYNLS